MTEHCFRAAKRIHIAALSLAFGLVSTETAHAQALQNLQEEPLDWTYLGAHLGASTVFALGALIAGAEWDASAPGPDVAPASLPAALSNGLYVFELAVPVPTLAAVTKNGVFANGMLIYAETLAAGAFVNNLGRGVKLDGRGTVAFAAAVSSGFMFREGLSKSGGPEPVGIAAGFWALQLGLASWSTHLHVRANHGCDALSCAYGKGLLGMLVGTGLGVSSYLVHEGTVELTAMEAVAGTGAILTGALFPLAFPFGKVDSSVAVVPLQFETGGSGAALQGAF